MSSPRRHLDQYFSPARATHVLQRHVSIKGSVFECCNGDGGISKNLRGLVPGEPLITNDIDTALEADFHFDVARPWSVPIKCDWVISNPPFNEAAVIIPHAYEYATVGVAMLLRLSYLEPCLNRAAWLAQYPPTQLIVLPRISFTGDGKTDNVTCAWFVWIKDCVEKSGITIVPRES